MKKRIISAIIMTLIVVPILYLGGIPLNIFIILLASVSLKELLNVKKSTKYPNIIIFIAYVCMFLLILSNVGNYSILFGLSYKTLSLVFILLLSPTIFLTKYKYTINDAFYLASITVFIGVVFNLFITLYNESVMHFLYVILIAITTDIFALLGGKLIGKNKFSKISPNKTIEGCIVGSIVGTIISATFYVTLISNDNIIRIIILSLILCIIGIIGDLFFSLIKRENNVKDFSNIIPGHGGLLDRIDSIIFIMIAFIFISQFI